eukprot:scaffold14725_cov144-Skeletonema_dohrnii-CCMP3373.AAC.3
MKLTLLILLLIGVVSATQDLSGSEAAQDLVHIEDASDKEAPSLRALKQQYCNYSSRSNPCGKKYRCNKSNQCVLKRKYGGGHHTGKDYYYYDDRGVNRNIGKRCNRNSQCHDYRLRCNYEGICELKRRYRSNRKLFYT